MAYHAIPNTPASPTSLEDDIDDFTTSPPFKSPHRRPLKTLWRFSVANLVLLVIQIVLLVSHIARQWLPPKENHFQATYGFDSNYMTLDHGYDWLWEDRAIQRAGAIALARDADDQVVEYGIISMYVANLRWRAFFTAVDINSGFISYIACRLFVTRFKPLMKAGM